MTLVQRPNAPLLIFAGAKVAEILTHGLLHRASAAVALIALSAWAYLELAQGANWARKTLGAVVLAYLVYSQVR